MDRFRPYRDQIAFAAALVLPLGVAGILVPFRGDFASTASALILVAVIVAVAALGNRFSGFVATLSATLWFDYFLTQPYERLAITHRPDIETAVCLFVVGIIVTELAARNRHHRAERVRGSRLRRSDLRRLRTRCIGHTLFRGARAGARHTGGSPAPPSVSLRRWSRHSSHDAPRARRASAAGRKTLGRRSHGPPWPRDGALGPTPRRDPGPLHPHPDTGLRGAAATSRGRRRPCRPGRRGPASLAP